MTNPNGKKIRDNRVAINLNHYEHQLLLAYSQLFGIDLAVLIRNLVIRKAQELLIHDQPIAYVLPSTGTLQIPLSYSAVPQADPKVGVAHSA